MEPNIKGVMLESPTVAAAAELGLNLLKSRDQWKNSDTLLDMLSSSDDSAVILEASKSLHSFFLPLLKSGEMAKSAEKEKDAAGNQKSTDEEASKEDGPLEFSLKTTYRSYTRALLSLIGKEKMPSNIKRWAVELLMELVRVERPKQFNNDLFSELCTTLVECCWLSGDLVTFLRENYFEYVDVRYSLYSNIRRRVTFHQSKLDASAGGELASSDDESDPSRPISVHAFARNTYDILKSIPVSSTPPKGTAAALAQSGTDKEGPQLAWCSDATEGRWRTAKWRKKASNDCWLTFLRLPLPVDIYKKVLVGLHSVVIPAVSSPLLLSDFLTDSYNVGGVVSVMALNGLFVLMTQHSLEYPNFYQKLYALLEPSIFTAKYRARFFELLDICLNSSHLPSYLAGAFAKRLARMALIAPPSGALIVIAAVHNLLRRHPSINTLVHRPEPSTSGVAGDPFLADESDPAKCNALSSSLWEVETLRQHYCPAVSRFVSSLETDLTVRAKTMEVPINDFTSGSYATILAEETGRRVKSASLAFYRQIPSTLFERPQAATSAKEPSFSVDHFSGWTFSPNPQPFSLKETAPNVENGALPKLLDGGDKTRLEQKSPPEAPVRGSDEVREADKVTERIEGGRAKRKEEAEDATTKQGQRSVKRKKIAVALIN